VALPKLSQGVAPPLGAWIEIFSIILPPYKVSVAPPLGAWIEIKVMGADRSHDLSLPPWERGLKFCYDPHFLMQVIVAPPLGAWIEIQKDHEHGRKSKRRSPLGSVD